MEDKLVKNKIEDPTSLSKSSQLSETSNLIKRTISGVSLGVGFFTVIWFGGVPAIFVMCFITQMKCVDEVLKIGYNFYKVQEVPFFCLLHWYLLIAANYFLFGETFIQHTQVYIKKYYVIDILASYHRFISFCLYFIGLIYFIGILRKKLMRQQFSLLFWTHFLLLTISAQAFMIYQVMFEGIIWLIMSVWLVTLNDIFAFIFGKYFGKTPLISVSPKKTVEGFICGGLSTVVFGAIMSQFLCHFKYLICPVKYVEVDNQVPSFSNCTPSYLFQPILYHLGNTGLSINYYPFIEHSFYLSIFASIIAPFGGFCASGFKRSVGIKDFADTLPGHGGYMDRCDCQFLMTTFVNVYVMTFVKHPEIEEIINKVMKLNDHQQLEFYSLLKCSLSNRLTDTIK